MSNRRLTEKEKKWLVGGGLVLFLLLSGLVCWFAGRPLIRFMNQPELFRQWVDQQGFWAPVAFVGMVVLQVVVAVIPGEPLEIAAGYAFGALEGTLLCILGTWIGGLTVFLLVRRFGTRAVEVFFPLEKLNELKFLKNERRLTFWVFLVFFLPGTPKDVLCYFVGLTKLPLKTWVLVSAVARIPSIVTSTVGGDALGMQNYTFAAAVFAATLVISGAGLLLYRAICRRQEEGGGAQ
ncbi:MAG: TVP38/TMEM64 family protein [Oscillospiraceae bacterium]|nr:TVP38/TMEM64 family protein [Oscillospiraceae bacterium]